LAVLAALLLAMLPLLAASALLAQGKVALERDGYPMAFQNGPRIVTFERQPSRILALGLGASELLAELGLADLIVGRTLEWPGLRPLPRYAKALSGIPEVALGSLLSAETQNDGPDFVFGSFGPLTPEPAFLKTYRLQAGNKDQLFGEVKDLARLFKVEPKAMAFLGDQEKRLAALSSKLARADRVKVLVVWDFQDGSLASAGGPDFATDILRLAGARNVFDDLGQSPSPDAGEAAARAPNFVLLVDDGRLPLPAKLEALRADPALSGLDAISQDRLLVLDGAYLLPGPRLAESAELLAKRFHPGLAD
jgi:iron complex transport system substrate-binding protein